MNKQRREAIENLKSDLAPIKERLDALMDEERDSQENKPEALQQMDATESLESASDNLENCIDDLEGIE